MRTTPFSILSLAVAMALAGNAMAQNDDCSGAIGVAQGANGPFTNVGSTTSSAWTCAFGGNDVWFVYVAPGSGSLTVDACGGGFDTIMELFNGNAGCGSLTSIGCNDDTCGLQSSVTVTVNTADTIYIRVGGYNSATGSFPINVNGPLPAGSIVATAANYGSGCVNRAGTFYELFTPPGGFDLNGTAMTLVRTNPGYIALPTGSFVAPTAAATVITLTDDSSAATPALTTPFPYDGGVAPTLQVCSNGSVWAAAGNSTGYNPLVATLLTNTQTGWYSWHDMNPGAAGSGQVKYEEVAGVAYVTWDGVYSYGTTLPNVFQMQFDEATGAVTYAWQSMNLTGSTLGNQGFLVGYKAGSATLDPGTRDISATLPSTFSCGNDLRAVALTAAARPIAGNIINLDTTNITPTAPFGAVTLGFTNPAFDLGLIGMAGCTQYTDSLVTLLYLPFGSPTVSVPFSVPNAIGLHILAQSFVYDPTANLTALGAMASNGVDLGIGNL